MFALVLVLVGGGGWGGRVGLGVRGPGQPPRPPDP